MNNWTKDILKKIDNLPDYMKEIFNIKDILFKLKDEEAEKRKAFDSIRTRRRFQEDKLERAYEGLVKFRK